MTRLPWSEVESESGGLWLAIYDLLRGKGERASLRENRQELRRLFAFTRPYRGRWIGGLVILVLAGLTSLAGPVTWRYLVDAIVPGGNPEHLGRITLLLIGVYLLGGILSWIGGYLLGVVGLRVVMDLRLTLYEHFQTLPLSFFTERRTGELVSRMMNDVRSVRDLVTGDLAGLLRQTVFFVGALGLILATDWRLTLFMGMLVPVVSVISILLGRAINQLSRSVTDEFANVTTVIDETLSSIRTVRSFVREDYEIGRFRGRLGKLLGLALQQMYLSILFGPLMGVLFLSSTVLIIWYGARQVLSGELSTGQLVTFVILTSVVGTSIRWVAGLWTRLQSALGACERLFGLLDIESEIREKPDARELPPVRGELTLDNVSFAYAASGDRSADEPAPEMVLREVSLAVRPGETLALVGPSGAGKSTLVSLIPRFYDPTAGRVLLDGIDLRDVRLAGLREQIGIVPQETQLFGGTVRENLLYGRLEASEEEMVEAARSANADEFIQRLPKGYDTVVGERGVRLSGGQRQRLAIARALLKNPRILLLDEATSALDNASEKMVHEALERLMEGRTSLIVAHRLSTVKMADRIAVLDDGRLVELGSHAELIALDGLYAGLWRSQFREGELVEDLAKAAGWSSREAVAAREVSAEVEEVEVEEVEEVEAAEVAADDESDLVDSAEESSRPPGRSIWLWASMALLALSVFFLEARRRPPEPLGVEAPPTVFSAARAADLLGELLAEGEPHPFGSPANARLRDRLTARLEALGYTPRVQRETICYPSARGSAIQCAEVHNVLARLEGREGGPAVLLNAHYDSVPAGPGASDNGAGVAAVLEIARLLRAEPPPPRPVIFLFSDGEEAGLFGARAFVRRDPWASEIAAVINLEARGTRGQSLLFETSEGNARLIEAYAEAPRPAASSLYFEVYKRLPNLTDLTVFKEASEEAGEERGMAGVNFAIAEHVAAYHTGLDTLENLDLGALQHHGENALAMVRALTDAPPASPEAGNRVYLDAFGYALIHWPEDWSIPFAAALFAIVLFLGAVLQRAGRLRLAQWLLGLGGALASLALAVALGELGGLFVALSQSSKQAWFAHPEPLRLALWATVGLAVLGVSLPWRRDMFWGTALGTWTVLAGLGLVTAVSVPGVSIYFILPTALAVLLLGAAAIAPAGLGGPRLAPLAVLLSACFTALLWMPVARSLEIGMGLARPLLVVLPLGLAGMAFTPLCLLADRRFRGKLLAATAGAVFLALLVASWVEPYTESAPRPLNFSYFEDADNAAAAWLVRSRGPDLPASMERAMGLEPSPREWLPGLADRARGAATEPRRLAAPDVEVLAAKPATEGRWLRLRLRPTDPSGRLRILLPESALPREIGVAGETFDLAPENARGGYHELMCWAGCDGLEIWLRLLAPPEDAEALIYEDQAGLPPGARPERPAFTTPLNRGDRTLVLHRVLLRAPLHPSVRENLFPDISAGLQR